MVKGSDIILILVAVIFPPAAAIFVAGCGCDLLINILLTSLGYLPGHLHAFYLIYKRMQAEERYGQEGYKYVGNATYEPIGYQQPVNQHPPLLHQASAPPAYGSAV
ncbi:hypothetical protein H4Q26_006263 [Puccinia striiformis f. sp. tritici PST-130]|uniref:Plasma membrane proteolipid 3 n=1 Tax=Puccinia striiformis f. sp. tritici PST-78 TaxID=1165861 RepID=A0A0L0UUE1_9BASI|nr:hypothetical protein Pst134EB_024960 [Puccinia striiformis f. sp. tritici]KAI9606726.1 hypothetical protein H4Q26_006263 [Puccinia striiformis f. sp. tritici PST-130]KNE90640.1 hypothetical protein PSTG_15903 [Puccinia striiformis f. sp. tritici PST-78]